MNESLFLPAEQCVLSAQSKNAPPLSPVIGKGSLVKFNYAFAKPGHDLSPLVLVTDIWPRYVRGLNLNYLTFPYIKTLLRAYGENPTFSYANIRGQDYIVSAFRQYKRNGIGGIQKLNGRFVMSVLSCVRGMDPNEVEAIRRLVREQIQAALNPQAAATAPNG